MYMLHGIKKLGWWDSMIVYSNQWISWFEAGSTVTYIIANPKSRAVLLNSRISVKRGRMPIASKFEEGIIYLQGRQPHNIKGGGVGGRQINPKGESPLK